MSTHSFIYFIYINIKKYISVLVSYKAVSYKKTCVLDFVTLKKMITCFLKKSCVLGFLWKWHILRRTKFLNGFLSRRSIHNLFMKTLSFTEKLLFSFLILTVHFSYKKLGSEMSTQFLMKTTFFEQSVSWQFLIQGPYTKMFSLLENCSSVSYALRN